MQRKEIIKGSNWKTVHMMTKAKEEGEGNKQETQRFTQNGRGKTEQENRHNIRQHHEKIWKITHEYSEENYGWKV